MLPVALAMLVLVLVLVATVTSGGDASQLPASGDALYDRMAQLVNADLHRHDWNLLVPDDYVRSSGLQIPSDSGRLSSSRVLDWQDEFGNDPRYWQLCWLLRSHSAATQYDADLTYRSSSFSDAWQRDIGDEASCYLMLMQAADEDARSELVSQGLERWPDNAYWHYRMADLALAAADWMGFRTALRQGNLAARNELPRPWPISALESDNDLPGDDDSLAVQGVIAQLARSQREGALRSPPDPLSIKKVSELDSMFIEEYITMQVRLALMDGNGLEQLWRPAVALNRLLNAEGLGNTWNEEERASLIERRFIVSQFAAADLPALFGREQKQAGLPQDASGNADEYHRNQLSWISTLKSYKLDQERARERGLQFKLLLSRDAQLLPPMQ